MTESNARTVESEEVRDAAIMQSKELRAALDMTLRRLKMANAQLGRTRERSLAVTKLQEAIMWLGMDLKERAGGKSCYKHGYDPSNAKVDLPADGVQL